MKVVHVVAVGYNSNRIMESIKESGYPIQKAYLIIIDDDVIKKVAKEIREALGVLVDIKEVVVDKYDVYNAALEILKNLREEIKEGSQIYINVTDAPKTVMVACYISAQIAKSKLYAAMPK